VEHSKGKGGERVVAIPRFQGGSPACVDKELRHFDLDGQALIYTDCMPDFMGSDKPSSLVTTLLKCTFLLQGGYVEGE
jgi:hypothetical protein